MEQVNKNWVEDFMSKKDDNLYIDNFKGTENLIMVCPFSSNQNWWLANSKQAFELSESGKRLSIVDYSNEKFPRVLKTFNMKSIVSFGYTK